MDSWRTAPCGCKVNTKTNESIISDACLKRIEDVWAKVTKEIVHGN